MTEERATSIISAVRSEGYRDGLGQASMIAYDDAFERGRQQGREEVQSAKYWWLMYGALVGGFIAGVLA